MGKMPQVGKNTNVVNAVEYSQEQRKVDLRIQKMTPNLLTKYNQQVRFATAMQKTIANKSSVAIYVNRDSKTGLRNVKSILGGEYQAQYISNTVPSEVFKGVNLGTSLNSGFIDQKPT